MQARLWLAALVPVLLGGPAESNWKAVEIAARSFGRERAHAQVRGLLALFDVAHVDRGVLDGALALEFADYEDAVLHEAARAKGMAAIVMRNGRDFAEATLPVFSPAELLAAVAAGVSRRGRRSRGRIATPMEGMSAV